MKVCLFRSVISQRSRNLCDFFVSADEQASVTKTAKIFRGIKTECPAITDRPGLLSAIRRPERLGSILQHKKRVRLSELEHRVHLRTQSEKVNWNDAFSSLRDLSRSVRHIDVVGNFIDVDEDRSRSHPGDASRRRKKGESR